MVGSGTLDDDLPPEPDERVGQGDQLGIEPPLVDGEGAPGPALEGQGGAVGPALDGVGNRIKQADIEKWLANPKAVRADAKMPQLPLSKDQIIELAAFLTTLHK